MNERGETITVTREELREIITDTVDETLLRMGLETDDPRQMQLDFLHLRNMRITMEQAQKRGVLVVIGILITALIALIVIGVKEWLRGVIH